MRKTLSIIILIFICSFTLCACDSKSKKELSDLQEEYDNLLSDYNTLQIQYGELQSDYEELQKHQNTNSNNSELEKEETRTEEIDVEENITTEKEITTEEAPSDWSEYASDITYDQLARTPDDYVGAAIQMTGEVIQLMEGDDTNAIRLATDDEWNNIIYIEYESSITAERILEYDKVTVYGWYYGIYQYESTMGQLISVPAIYAKHIEIDK